MLKMTVRYKRDIELYHVANYTCGGVTGHARECIRSICREVVHENCTHDMIHTTREIER